MAISFQMKAQLSLKMRGYPQFSFWILIALLRSAFSHSRNLCKNTSVLEGTVLVKKPAFLIQKILQSKDVFKVRNVSIIPCCHQSS